MKRLFIVLVLGTAMLLSACSKPDISGIVSGRNFIWEKEGFGGDFTITLNDDGSYTYYEGFLSSYLGYGDWTVEDDTVVLTEKGGYDAVYRFAVEDDTVVLTEKGGYDAVYRFAVEDGALVYKSDGSDQFIYTTVEDGDRFTPTEKEQALKP